MDFPNPPPAPVKPSPQPRPQDFVDSRLRIRNALAKMMVIMPSQTATILGGYFSLVSPTRHVNGHSEFPKTVRRHALFPENDAFGGGRFNLLYFSVGSAILGYYEQVRGGKVPTMEARLVLLESLGSHPIEDFEQCGDEQHGFYLALKNEKVHQVQSDTPRNSFPAPKEPMSSVQDDNPPSEPAKVPSEV